MTPEQLKTANVNESPISDRFSRQWQRYRSGEYRAPLFAEIVLDDLAQMGPRPTVLDIGCGGGFDGNVDLQRRIGAVAGKFVGIEPADDVTPADCFSEVYRCLLESAPIPTGSIDLAYSVMVVEHVADPQGFMDALARLLRPGGIFWAFTIDARHWSAWASLLLEHSRTKALYMNTVLGARGKKRWQNYPVEYKLNSPTQLRRHTSAFQHVDCMTLYRPGAENSSLPALLRGPNRALDALLNAVGAPGSNFVFRLVL